MIPIKKPKPMRKLSMAERQKFVMVGEKLVPIKGLLLKQQQDEAKRRELIKQQIQRQAKP